MSSSFTEKQGNLMNKLGVKFTDKTTKEEATSLIDQYFKKNDHQSERVKPVDSDKPGFNQMSANCDRCDGEGYVLLEHQVHKSTTIGACDHCERGKHLQARERHPIGSISRCYALGYLPIARAS
jgi:hypothetical protein